MYERAERSWGSVPRVLALLGLSAVGGALTIVGVDPGYDLEPVPLFLALVCACLCVPLVRTLARNGFRPLVLAAVVAGPAVVGAAWLDASAPKAIDRRAYTSVETALLAQVAAYAGSPGRPHTDPSTGSDWGISFLNPPETYLTSRVDPLPPDAPVRQVGRFYADQLRRAGLAVSHFGLHMPPAEEEVDGERGAVLISAVIEGKDVRITARCQRNGPFDPRETEPPCHAPHG